MKHKPKKHEFAIHIPHFSQLIAHVGINGVLTLKDKDVMHRMIHILRLKPMDTCILFDQSMHGVFQIEAFAGKKSITGILIQQNNNRILTPHITFLLPVLKRDDLHDAIYFLTEMGVNTIQLVMTQKVQRSLREHELERLQRVVIAAAEQSKYFAYPDILKPISFTEILKNTTAEKIFFEPDGISSIELSQQLQKQNKKKVVLFVGPEGDLTEEEKKQLQKNDFTFVALTPTVLKASHAAALGAGIVRSHLL